MDNSSNSRNILINTILWIISIILIFLFLNIAYGIVIDKSHLTYMGDVISEAFFCFLEWLFFKILLPCVMFLYIPYKIWDYLTAGGYETTELVFESPTLSNNSQNSYNGGHESGENSSRGGEKVKVWKHYGSGGQLVEVVKNSKEHLEILEKNHVES